MGKKLSRDLKLMNTLRLFVLKSLTIRNFMLYVMLAEYYSIAVYICTIHLLAISTIAKYLFSARNM